MIVDTDINNFHFAYQKEEVETAIRSAAILAIRNTTHLATIVQQESPIKIEIVNNEALIIDNQYPERHLIAKNISEIFSYINETFENIERLKKSKDERSSVKSISLRII